MSTFSKYVRTILDQAGREAQLDRSASIEAQHVLLAIAAQPDTAPGQVLSSIGLDQRAIREALEHELEHSLSSAGVSRAAFNLPSPSASGERVKQLGASVKYALERGVAGIRKGKHLRPAHLLLGILRAEVGTVPRALALAGIDRPALMARVEQALTAT